MHIHYLQHVPFEDLGSMEAWFRAHGHSLSVTHLYKDESLPQMDSFDWLVVMGGPMSVTDLATYPWLTNEKAFIKQAIDEKKIVLGICLGAQLIADVLGATISKNTHKEIGWYPIQLSDDIKAEPLGAALPCKFDVFHWHGDMFSTPDKAISLASSEACRNQGFMIDNRILGLQFHLETTLESARGLTIQCKEELDNSQYVQSAKDMLSRPKRFEEINVIMDEVLGLLEKTHAD
jgi:GMP synthase-like glutamine amidotransferase